MALSGLARADAPLSQGFEDGAPAWSATGMWHVQPNPQTITVVPAIADRLVTLPDDGSLPAAVEGSNVAWFGEAATGTYCGSDFGTLKQTPSDGCTSTHVEQGTLTSPSFSLAGHASAYAVFRAWWEIEAVNADIADQMRVEYSTDGGGSWQLAGLLNPLDPSWGGRAQPYADDGARESGSWQPYAVDLSAAAGQPDVRLRFAFDTGDRYRNGFRGLMIDGVGIVDALGATITEPGAGTFTDQPPSVSTTQPTLTESPGGGWTIHFDVGLSDPTNHDVTVDWTVTGADGRPVATGQVVIPAGQTQVPVDVPVTGDDAPYTVTIADPVGATLAPGGDTSTTPGGALPLLSIDSLTADAGPAGTVDLTLGVRLSKPATWPVTVDYAATGSDGVQAAASTVSFPPGTQTASVTMSLPADHAPYSVGLFNPHGALIDPTGATLSTSPLAAVANASVNPADAQAVLGVRIAAGDTPTLNETFFLTAVSGTIRYHTPGKPYQELGSATIELPFGSVVDTTHGHALITVSIDKNGTLQRAELWQGKAGIFQSGTPPFTEFRLAGGDFSACVKSARLRSAHSSKRKVVRRLWASAKGNFRTKGRFASATIRGTRWLTEDLCQATRVVVAEGIVAVRDARRRHTYVVTAGHSRTVKALTSGRFRSRSGLHQPRLSRH